MASTVHLGLQTPNCAPKERTIPLWEQIVKIAASSVTLETTA